MPQFIKIDFDTALQIFDQAETNGSRWRVGELTTSQWLQKNTINLDDIVDFSRNMPDSKIVIIGEGATEGFYIYSQKQKTCFKFKPKLAEI